MAMFTLDGIGEDKRLTARFPRIHEEAQTEIYFQRTLRVPEDGNIYPLPAGTEPFPLRHLEDFDDKLPRSWRDRGGVMMPMYRAEAMWIRFDERYPCAIKIGAGKINVLNGRRWTEELDGSTCDYIAAPPQPALDGYRTGEDLVRQFVAMPLGEGYSVEEQITSTRHGGIQIVVYPMKSKRYAQLRAEHAQAAGGSGAGWSGHTFNFAPSEPLALSLAPGGCLSERIYDDPYGIDAWDRSARARCIVTLVNVEQWIAITGGRPPGPPFSPEDYEKHGLKWFKYFDDDLQPLGGASGLGRIESVSEVRARKGLQVSPAGAIQPGELNELRPVRPPRRSRDPKPSVRALWGALGLFRG